MSKKHKKFNKKNKVKALMNNSKGDKGEKLSRANKKVLKKAKHLSPSLKKKEAKAIEKFANRYPDMPGKIAGIRARCNHAAKTMSLAEYNEFPNHYNPTLDLMIDAFGEQQVVICRDCMEPMVDAGIANEGNLKVSIATLIGIINYIEPRVKMSEKELIKHYEKKQKLLDLLSTLTDELAEAVEHDDAVRRVNNARNIENEHYKGARQNVTKLGSTEFARDDDDDE